MKFDKNKEYYDGIRYDLIGMLPVIKGKFLDIGCGTGKTLEYLKLNGASYVAGIDNNNDALHIAKLKNIDFLLQANVENNILPFKEKEFDCIILADILEHLINPWLVLQKLVQYMQDDGCMLISIPNIKYFHVLRRLIFHDEWTYETEGILDNTHLRFFTLKESKKLLDDAGLRILKMNSRSVSGLKFKILNALLFNKIYSFSVWQYHILAAKK